MLQEQPLDYWKALYELLKVRQNCFQTKFNTCIGHARLMCHQMVSLQDAVVAVTVMESSMQVEIT